MLFLDELQGGPRLKRGHSQWNMKMNEAIYNNIADGYSSSYQPTSMIPKLHWYLVSKQIAYLHSYPISSLVFLEILPLEVPWVVQVEDSTLNDLSCTYCKFPP